MWREQQRTTGGSGAGASRARATLVRGSARARLSVVGVARHVQAVDARPVRTVDARPLRCRVVARVHVLPRPDELIVVPVPGWPTPIAVRAAVSVRHAPRRGRHVALRAQEPGALRAMLTAAVAEARFGPRHGRRLSARVCVRHPLGLGPGNVHGSLGSCSTRGEGSRA
jgi:hypothetical protein